MRRLRSLSALLMAGAWEYPREYPREYLASPTCGWLSQRKQCPQGAEAPRIVVTTALWTAPF